MMHRFSRRAGGAEGDEHGDQDRQEAEAREEVLVLRAEHAYTGAMSGYTVLAITTYCATTSAVIAPLKRNRVALVGEE